MRNIYPEAPAAADNRHPDGSIRCNAAFHSVRPDDDDRVEVRIQILVTGRQTRILPTEGASRVAQRAFRDAGIEIIEARAVVLPPEHNCDALIAADTSRREAAARSALKALGYQLVALANSNDRYCIASQEDTFGRVFPQLDDVEDFIRSAA